MPMIFRDDDAEYWTLAKSSDNYGLHLIFRMNHYQIDTYWTIWKLLDCVTLNLIE